MGEAWKSALEGLSGLGKSLPAKPESTPKALTSIEPERAAFPWTPAQQEVIRDRSSRIQVRALAGSGKTRVLTAYAQARSRARLTYLTFNATLARAAQAELPSTIKARTFHGLAFPRFGEPLAPRLKHTWHPGDLNRILHRDLPPQAEHRWREVLLRTLDAFIASADALIEPGHIDRSNWYLARTAGDAIAQTDRELIQDAERLWQALIDPSAPWPVTHDLYLKLWCLAEVRWAGDGLLVDEDQDLTPALHAWLEQQPGFQVRVGDPYQAIYGFRGARGQQVLTGATTHVLPESFRFGVAIAEQANGVLARLGEDRLRGCGPLGTVQAGWVNHPGTRLLARTHTGLLDAALDAVEQGIPLAQAVQVPQQIEAVLALAEGRLTDIRDPWVAGFATFEAFEAAVQQGGLTAWRAACLLVRKRGKRLHAQLKRLRTPRDPNGWHLATVHSVKGQTFDHVALANDLLLLDPVQAEGREEAHVTYVAMTRARLSLNLHSQWAPVWERWRLGGQSKPVDLADDGF